MRGTSFNACGATEEDDGVAGEMEGEKTRGRCGGWGGAYFKSTDGHFGTWSFSLKRLNLGVLSVLGEFGG